MFLGDKWISIDGVEYWSLLCPTDIVSNRILQKLAFQIREKQLWVHNLRWAHRMRSRCSAGGVIRHNTNDTIKKFKKKANWDRKLCSTCRGKGHSWKAQIWNGKPYLIPKGQQPKGNHWNNPDYCENCKGSGFA